MMERHGAVEFQICEWIFQSKDANLLSAFSFGDETMIKSLKIWDMSK